MRNMTLWHVDILMDWLHDSITRSRQCHAHRHVSSLLLREASHFTRNMPIIPLSPWLLATNGHVVVLVKVAIRGFNLDKQHTSRCCCCCYIPLLASGGTCVTRIPVLMSSPFSSASSCQRQERDPLLIPSLALIACWLIHRTALRSAWSAITSLGSVCDGLDEYLMSDSSSCQPWKRQRRLWYLTPTPGNVRHTRASRWCTPIRAHVRVSVSQSNSGSLQVP